MPARYSANSTATKTAGANVPWATLCHRPTCAGGSRSALPTATIDVTASISTAIASGPTQSW